MPPTSYISYKFFLDIALASLNDLVTASVPELQNIIFFELGIVFLIFFEKASA